MVDVAIPGGVSDGPVPVRVCPRHRVGQDHCYRATKGHTSLAAPYIGVCRVHTVSASSRGQSTCDFSQARSYAEKKKKKKRVFYYWCAYTLLKLFRAPYSCIGKSPPRFGSCGGIEMATTQAEDWDYGARGDCLSEHNEERWCWCVIVQR